ncbi:MAG: hypothetical protein CBHOC_3461, partial [uncultured Caballeronia sp.]
RGLQPHRSESLKRSPDQFFIEKLRDVGGLYLKSARKCAGAVRGREDNENCKPFVWTASADSDSILEKLFANQRNGTLAKAESWSDIKADKVAQLFSTCGAELVVEFDALEVREDSSPEHRAT